KPEEPRKEANGRAARGRKPGSVMVLRRAAADQCELRRRSRRELPASRRARRLERLLLLAEPRRAPPEPQERERRPQPQLRRRRWAGDHRPEETDWIPRRGYVEHLCPAAATTLHACHLATPSARKNCPRALACGIRRTRALLDPAPPRVSLCVAVPSVRRGLCARAPPITPVRHSAHSAHRASRRLRVECKLR